MWQHREDRLKSAKSLPNGRLRRETEPVIPAQHDDLRPDAPCREGGLRYSRGSGRQRRMIVGESRDQHQHHLLPATAAATAISSFSSHLKSSHPLRKRALTSSYHSSSIESPSLPSPSAPRHAPLYDRRRPSVRNLSLSNVPNPSSPSLSPIPNSKQNRNSLNVLPLSSPLSPNAPKRELSRHISHHAVRSDVNTTMPSTVAYDEDSALTGQSGRAMNGVDRDQEEAPRTPLTADAAPRNEEDIFLNIARSDPSRRGSLGLSELKRSHRLSNHSLRSPHSLINGQSPPPEQLRHNYDNNPLHENRTSPSSPYNRGTPSLVSAPPIDDLPRSRYSGIESSSRSTIGLPQSRFSRTGPDISPRSRAIYPDRRSSLQEHRPYRHSTLSTIRSSRHPAEIAERTLYDGTESTISTTAPSTVWDDLEEMKSRIRKLELTGKLPPSREAMHSTTGERPRTAATTATSLSSSPKLLSSPNRTRRVSNTVEEPEASTAIGQVHPLLQSSLSKAKNVVSRNVYNALEITVSNSVKLSTMLGSGNPPGSVSTVNGSGSSDRLARRKADLICRSLTELCLAMTEEQLNKQPSPSHKGNSDEQQRNGTDGDVTPISPYQRDGSQEPDGIVHRRSSTRVSSNLEAQRSNLANTINNWQHQVQADFNQTSSPSSEVPAGRLNRLSTSSRTRRLQLGDEHEDGASPHTSSLSRAMTDINPATSSQRGPPRQRVSHDYRASYSTVRSPQTQSSAYQSLASTSHPHPTPRTPSLPQSGLPFHRSYITPSSNTPSTFRSSIQAGSSRYGFTPSPSDRSPALNVPRLSQPEPSQTKIVAPSSKLATSYTPISQNRPRTNSLDTRRFPTRQRAVSTVNDPVHIDGS